MPASGGQESFGRELWTGHVSAGKVCACRTPEDRGEWTPRVREGRAALAEWET